MFTTFYYEGIKVNDVLTSLEYAVPFPFCLVSRGAGAGTLYCTHTRRTVRTYDIILTLKILHKPTNLLAWCYNTFICHALSSPP